MVLLRGALIEYASDFLGPLPNLVIFQFNPDTLTRNFQIPQRPTGAASRETSQAGEIPVEKINLTASFSLQRNAQSSVSSAGLANLAESIF